MPVMTWYPNHLKPLFANRDFFKRALCRRSFLVIDDKKGSATQGSLEEITVSEERLQVVRIPGHYWHGTKTLGVKPSVTLYCLNRLYDPKNPDEERRAWDDPSILDPKTREPFDWNKLPFK